MDEAHAMTDARLAELSAKLSEVYAAAEADISQRIDAFARWFDAADRRMRERVDAGKLDPKKYRAWRLDQVRQSEQYAAVRDKIAVRMTRTNEIAVAYVNDATPGIYSLNYNYVAYQIEGAENVDFTLLDERTMRRLLMYDPALLPNYPPERAVSRGIDLEYGRRQINSVVVSGLLQGKTIPAISDDLKSRIGAINSASATRLVRTAVTSAECGGRLDGLLAAAGMGIDARKEWIATLDDRTRHSHAMLDGAVADRDERFSNGCRYPGDPLGPAEEVYNCRCTIAAVLPEESLSDASTRRAKNSAPGSAGRRAPKWEIIAGMTFAEWLDYKNERARNAK